MVLHFGSSFLRTMKRSPFAGASVSLFHSRPATVRLSHEIVGQILLKHAPLPAGPVCSKLSALDDPPRRSVAHFETLRELRYR